ncbi:MAG: aminotransferase class IV [Castellaniella sp.]|uniref:aminotransferase class IV n=1 Tax=Castellaniella sp. TaxID=1955812 RepID=UPI003C70822D
MESPRPESGVSRAGPAGQPGSALPAPPAAEIRRLAPDLIETLRLEQGRIALWPGHRARLQASAQALGYPLDAKSLDGWMAGQIRDLGAGEAVASRPDTDTPPASAPQRLRLLLAADGRLSLESAPLPPTAEPVRLAWAADVLGPDAVLDARDPWLRHKTTHRPRFAAAQAWLHARSEYFDLIFCNTAGDVCEGSRSTIYVRDADGAWLTPPLVSGLLPGVRRQALLDAGAAREARLSPADLHQATALQVSNALRGCLDARLS